MVSYIPGQGPLDLDVDHQLDVDPFCVFPGATHLKGREWAIRLDDGTVLIHLSDFSVRRYQPGKEVVLIARDETARRFADESAWKRAVEHAHRWRLLLSSMRRIMDTHPRDGVAGIGRERPHERLLWFATARRDLESQLDNPFLVANVACLRRWRKAVEGSRVAAAGLVTEAPEGGRGESP